MLLALALWGCDPNASAACDAGGPSLGEQCTQVYTTLCAQGPRCNIAVDQASCVSQSVAAHCPCSVEACDAGSCATLGSMSACQSDLAGADCNYIVNFATPGYVPMDCQPFVGSM